MVEELPFPVQVHDDALAQYPTPETDDPTNHFDRTPLDEQSSSRHRDSLGFPAQETAPSDSMGSAASQPPDAAIPHGPLIDSPEPRRSSSEPLPSSFPHVSAPPIGSPPPSNLPLTHLGDQPLPEQDTPPLASTETLIPVQSFTPILGTLLLSLNPHVGGPARFAVVELLKRIRRADESEGIFHPSGPSPPAISSGTSMGANAWPSEDHLDSDDEEEPLSPLGLFRSDERRLFEREMIQQVVIGMGRLDIPDESTESESGGTSTTNDEDHSSEETPSEPSDLRTPLARPPQSSAEDVTPGATERSADSYFPPVPSLITDHEDIHSVDDIIVPLPELSSPVFISLPLTTDPDAAPSSSSSLVFSPSPSPSPSPLSPPSPAPSATSFSASSTPSLVSSSSSSAIPSGEDVSPPAVVITEGGPSLASTLFASSSFSVQFEEDRQHEHQQRQFQMMGNEGWVQTSSSTGASDGQGSGGVEEGKIYWDIGLPRYDTASTTSFGNGGGVDEVGVMNMGWSVQRSEWEESEEESQGEQALDSEEAAVGRLSSMSLMAAVTASGQFRCYFFCRWGSDGCLVIGTLTEEVKMAFVTELQRVGCDPIYWVRREACFALGALAKSVPVDVVISSLVSAALSLYKGDSLFTIHYSIR